MQGVEPGTDPISTHALHEEGDTKRQSMGAAVAISIHALREEGDKGAPGR